VHSAFVQLVEIRFNQPRDSVPESGLLTEMSVPYSQPYDYSSAEGWQPTSDFRLYYGSTHWVVDVVEGPGNFPWYKIEDELYKGYYYYVPAAHLRPIPKDELTPISPDVPPADKRIEVSLTYQTLTAYEADQIVMRTQVSTGIPSKTLVDGYPTETPVGNHFVLAKTPSKHMGTSRLTDSLGDRALPGVPWTAFFAEGGYAIHGAYWHNNFGLPMSRGCINMRNSDSKWLWRWVNPVWNPEVQSIADWEVRGLGTPVIVME
jgi:lipoprotein-anchoring transpeptidase ErfK/SrfK